MLLFPDLTSRVFEPEVMDDPDLDEREHLLALRGLERLNAASRTVPQLWRAMRHLAGEPPREGPVKILDIATGGGDVPVGLWRRAQRHTARRGGPGWEVAACDMSQRALDTARKKAEASGAGVRFFRWNAFEDPLPDEYDVITSSLFLHHLPDDEHTVKVLAESARAARRLVVMSDLRRNRSGYWLAILACYLFSRSRVVHADGPQSVRAAFTITEVRELAERAGMTGARVRACWPHRWLLTWSPA